MLRNMLPAVTVQLIHETYALIVEYASRKNVRSWPLLKVTSIRYLSYVKNILNNNIYKTQKIFPIARLIEDLNNILKNPDNEFILLGLDLNAIKFMLDDVLHLGSHLRALLPDNTAKNYFINVVERLHTQCMQTNVITQNSNSLFSSHTFTQPATESDSVREDDAFIAGINNIVQLIQNPTQSIHISEHITALAEAYKNYSAYLGHSNRLSEALDNTNRALDSLNALDSSHDCIPKGYLRLYRLCLMNDLALANSTQTNYPATIDLLDQAYSYNSLAKNPTLTKYKIAILKNLLVCRLQHAITLFITQQFPACLTAIDSALACHDAIPPSFYEDTDSCMLANLLHFHGATLHAYGDHHNAFESVCDSIEVFHKLTANDIIVENANININSKTILNNIIAIFLKQSQAKRIELNLKRDFLSYLHQRSDSYLKYKFSNAIIKIGLNNAKQLLDAKKLDNADVELFNCLELWNSYVKPYAQTDDESDLRLIYLNRVNLAFTEFKQIEDVDKNLPQLISTLQKIMARINTMPAAYNALLDKQFIETIEATIQEYDARAAISNSTGPVTASSSSESVTAIRPRPG